MPVSKADPRSTPEDSRVFNPISEASRTAILTMFATAGRQLHLHQHLGALLCKQPLLVVPEATGGTTWTAYESPTNQRFPG